MSELFQEKVSFSWVFDVIKQAHHHTFQILTKRAERMAAFCRRRTVLPGRGLPGQPRPAICPERLMWTQLRNNGLSAGMLIEIKSLLPTAVE